MGFSISLPHPEGHPMLCDVLSWLAQYAIGTSNTCLLERSNDFNIEWLNNSCILPAILRFHSTNVRINLSIWAASRSRVSPTRLAAMSCRLAVFLVGPHYSLSETGGFLLLEATRFVFCHFEHFVIARQTVRINNRIKRCRAHALTFSLEMWRKTCRIVSVLLKCVKHFYSFFCNVNVTINT